MFWVGIVFVIFGFYGGPILSYLHDALMIPMGPFTAYENFGWVNQLVAVVGTVVMIIGFVLVAWGLMKIRNWRNRMEELLEEPDLVSETSI